MEDEILVAVAIVSAVTIFSGMITGTPNALVTGTAQIDITGIPIGLNLTFNGLPGNASYTRGSSVFILAELNVSNKTVRLDINKTGWTTMANTTPLATAVTFSDAGTYNVTAWFADDLTYYPVSVTYYITITAPPVPPTPGGGGGGGGGGGKPPTLPVVHGLQIIIINDHKVLINGTNLDPGQYFADIRGARQLPFYGLGFKLINGTEHLEIIIEHVPKPAQLSGVEQTYPDQIPYKYVKVTVIGANPNISFTTISVLFSVDTDWILKNNIDTSSITLYRYGSWIPLRSISAGEADGYYRLISANLPVISSYYVISAKEAPFGAVVLPSQAGPYYMQLAIFALAISLLLLIAGRPKPRKKKPPMVRKPITTKPHELYSTWAYGEHKEEKEEIKGKKAKKEKLR